jgi:hypothetical protein
VNRRCFLLSALAALLPCCRGKDGSAAPWPKARGLWLSPPWEDYPDEVLCAFLIGAPADVARLRDSGPPGREIVTYQRRVWRYSRFLLLGSQIQALRSAGAVQCATEAEFAAAEQRLWDDYYRR